MKEPRQVRMRSKGWREEGLRLLTSARAYGLCACCGKPLRSRFPVGDNRRRVFCNGGRYPERCSDAFYELYYQAWNLTKRVVLKRVKERFHGDVRCENCGAEPREEKRERSYETKDWKGRPRTITYTHWTHPGYEFDHKVEVNEGGDVFDPANVWLLCRPCHRLKTRAYLKRGASATTPPRLHRLDEYVDDGHGKA